jgi:HEAT repeat protein/thiol-disulfide isomerase/thioredoxin
MRWLPLPVALGILCIGSPTVLAQESKPEVIGTPKAASPQRAWLTDLARGRADAVQNKRPILVRIGAEWCPWCKKLDQEILLPDVQTALGGWTLVVVDADRSADDLQALGVGPIPALRVLSPLGRVVASRDGFLPAKDLVAWLDEHREKSSDTPVEELSDTKEPSAVALVRLVRQLDQPDALLRETAIHRLQGRPALAAEPVVAAFADGTLQRRLAALELLSLWQAPVAGLDPWQPRTISVERLKGLRDWASLTAKAKAAAAPESKGSPARLVAAAAEIDRIQTAEPAEVPAIRERLARVGRDLLPTVYDRLKKVEGDDERERLTALRYRLVGSDGLAMKWPGGLERLAATAVATRHKAVDELVQLASADDEALWLELFSDPDPLVRETALKGLNAIDSSGSSKALIGLLADPEPNVRAAVLKQLAERPSSRLVARLEEYVAKETDPDLVVHAVRVLREIKDVKALKVLIDVLKHPEWSVRAEAVEGIGKQVELHANRSQNNSTASNATAEGITALIERLDDPDGFVVGRAITALKEIDSADAVAPLIKVIEKHPELASKAIESLVGWRRDKPTMTKKALPLLRGFAEHARADVRAAVVAALGGAKEEDLAVEVLAGLSDSESTVRISAAKVIFAKYETLRQADPSTRNAESEPPAPGGENPSEKWLTHLQEGKGKPKSMQPSIAPLIKMLASPSAEERLAAALPLIAAGTRSQAATELVNVAKEQPDLIGKASDALPWRHWPERTEMFRALRAAHPGQDEVVLLVRNFSEVNDVRAADLLWGVIVSDDVSAQAIAAIYEAIRKSYFGQNYYNPSNTPKGLRRQVAAAIRQRSESGSQRQRSLALSMLLSASPDESAEVARKIRDDPTTPPGLHRDAFQILLMSGDRAEGLKMSLAALAGSNPTDQLLALRFITSDFDSLTRFREGISLSTDSPVVTAMSNRGGDDSSRLPKLPRDLKPEMVKPLLTAKDSETVARAGYTLALLEDPEGLKALLDYAIKPLSNEDSWNRMAYQAIAQAGDDTHVPVLEMIYNRLHANVDKYGSAQNIKDLYWTIRSMDGPNARKLRKRIRHEVGMPFLRGEAGISEWDF